MAARRGARRTRQSRAERNIAWIESHCLVPDGIHAGRPFKLRPWQKRFIRGIYNSPTRRAIISVGRKNGKTAVAAVLLLLHLCGPEARPNTELFSTALSRDQAAIVFGLAAKIVRLSPGIAEYVGIRETVKQLYCDDLGTLYRALSAEASTAFGYSPAFVVHDELGQVRGSRHALYEALETATAAQASPLSIIISTQAPNDADLLSVLIDDALKGHDPETKIYLWTAPAEADAFTVKAIRAANPAYGDFQRSSEVRAMARAAKRMPSREAQYRNLVLNQRVDTSQSYISPEVWKQNSRRAELCEGLYGGLDLSQANDLTSLVLVSVTEEQEFHVWPTFWLPADGLAERSDQDRVPYDLWHARGYLETTPGRSIDYELVAGKIAKLFQDFDIRKIAFDRWGMRHLVPWLVRKGLPEPLIAERFVGFGQGYRDMSPALRSLEAALLERRIRHGAHPVLTMCAANSVVKMDEAGNRKLDRVRSRGRIDGMVALAMAVAVATEEGARGPVYPVPVSQVVESL